VTSRADLPISRGQLTFVAPESECPSGSGSPRWNGGSIDPPLLRYTAPVCPPPDRAALVLLERVTDPNGVVREVKPLRGPPDLVEVAADAVKQWQYAKACLAGVAIPAIGTVAMHFPMDWCRPRVGSSAEDSTPAGLARSSDQSKAGTPSSVVDLFADRHRLASAQGLSDVALEVTFAQGGTTYRLGAPLELKLRFHTDTKEKYEIEGLGGKPVYERFVIDRVQDVMDPMCGYFVGGVVASIPSAPSRYLTEELVPITLTDHFQFTKPGRYRLFVKSGSVGVPAPHSLIPVPMSKPKADVVSNVLEFTLTERDPVWERSVVNDARTALASGTIGEQLAAVRRLRVLGTPDASRELARVFASSGSFDAEVGLLSAPDAVAARDALLQAPVPANTADMVVLLARIDLRRIYLDCCRPIERTSPCKDDQYIRRYNELLDKYRARLMGSPRQ
jgi:hypothetical protein